MLLQNDFAKCFCKASVLCCVLLSTSIFDQITADLASSRALARDKDWSKGPKVQTSSKVGSAAFPSNFSNFSNFSSFNLPGLPESASMCLSTGSCHKTVAMRKKPSANSYMLSSKNITLGVANSE